MPEWALSGLNILSLTHGQIYVFLDWISKNSELPQNVHNLMHKHVIIQ